MKMTSDGIFEGQETNSEELKEKGWKFSTNFAADEVYKKNNERCLIEKVQNRMRVWFIFKSDESK